jgi:hypothetical protein
MEGLYTTILHDKRKQLGLTINEYCFLDSVYHLSRKKGYCFKSKKNFADFLGISERQVYNMIDKLIEKNLLFRDEQKFLYVTTQFCSIYEKISDMQKFHNDTEKISVDPMQKFQYDTEKISYNINTIYTEDNNINNNTEKINFSDIFEDFRIYYRSMGGKVLGLETEFKNFKKHKDWKNEINNLKSGAEKYFHLNKNNDKKYLKHLKTFINNREWEIDFEIVNEEDQLKVFLSKFNEYELYLYNDSLTDYLKMLIKNNWDNEKMENTAKYLRKYFMNTWPYMVRGLLEKASMSNQFVIDFENYSHRMQDFEEKQWREEFNDYDKLKYHI